MVNTIALTTTASIGGVEVADQIPTFGSPKMEIVKLVIQAIIGIVGLIKLLKAKKTIKQSE
jgi:hypothetical protein